MNKEEILAKSRQENKNRDIAEIDHFKSAARFALIISMAFTALWTMLSLFATQRVNYGIIAVEFCMSFSTWLYRAIKSKKAADILLAAVSGLTFLIPAFIGICELFGLKP